MSIISTLAGFAKYFKQVGGPTPAAHQGTVRFCNSFDIWARTAADDNEARIVGFNSVNNIHFGDSSFVMFLDVPGRAMVPQNFPFWIGAFNSAQQAITAGGSTTLAHGLGVDPLNIVIDLVNVTAEGGYTAGQILRTAINANFDHFGTNTGVAVRHDATNIVVVVGADGLTLLDTGGNWFNITAANWKFIVRAQA